MNSSAKPRRSRLANINGLLVALVLAFPRLSVGFAPSPSKIVTTRTTQLHSETQPSSLIASSQDDLPQLSGALEKCELHEFILQNHKPLGCSVEESLAEEPDGTSYVFVAELTEGSNAENAGIQVGDVVVQLSGTFDEVIDVAGLGLSKIRSLVSGRLKEQPLTIRIARGSDVMERHESALVDLCIIGEDPNTAECINAIHSQERFSYIEDDVVMDCQEDDDTECMLDSLWDTWTEGLPIKTLEEENAVEKQEVKKKVAPWSSRSSPSGTWVRDPATGEMRNIDE